MNRRDFSKALLSAIASHALLESAWASHSFTGSIAPLTSHWVLQLNQYCADLKTTTINPIEWQQLVRPLFEEIELPELMRFIDFDRLRKSFNFPDLGVSTSHVKFPKLNGLPENTCYIKKIFGMQKNRAIIPHGHSNMTSAHLVLSGVMHLRHYNKIRIDGQHLIIQPTIDKNVMPGDFSSISDDQDNVHWFIAKSDHAFTFDVIVLDLNQRPFEIHNLDILESQSIGDGTQRVPILNVSSALKKYGKLQHH